MLKKAINYIIIFLGKVRWESLTWKISGRRYNLVSDDLEKILSVLYNKNCIILTRRKRHLSTYMTAFANFILTGKFGYWSHVLMNLEPEALDTVESLSLYESIGAGVTKSEFMKVFDCDAVCLLEPYHLPEALWQEALCAARESIGVPYDGSFNLKDTSKMSCVEYVRFCIKRFKDYPKAIKNLEAMIEYEGNLTPDMYYECGDFKVLLEIRK